MGRIDDGHSTKVSFSEEPSVYFWEKTVTPPGVAGGGENDTTTMHNQLFRTRAPKQLRTLTPSSFTAAYDPAVYPQIMDMINVNQQITVHFPDGQTLTFWGWLDDFSMGSHEEGSQPEATVTVIPSNQNTTGIEVGPVLG